jgi:tetratricopeptide (TPR) repeat protein
MRIHPVHPLKWGAMKRLSLVVITAVTVFLAADTRATVAAPTWFEIRTPNFVVWADENNGPTRALVWQMEQIRNVAKHLWPWMNVDLPRPLVVVAVKSEQSLKALAPRFWEVKGGVRPGSVWVSSPFEHYIAIRTDMPAQDAVMINPHHSAYFSYANLIMTSSFEGPLPMWLSRGLSGVLSNTLIRQNDVVVGSVIPWHIDRMREHRMPLRQMLTVTRSSPEFRGNDAQRDFDAQAWAFVHYLLLGEDGINAPKLNAFVASLARGQAADTAFAEAIGRVDDYERGFVSYVNRSMFAATRVKVDLGLDRERFPARPMSPAEDAVARASFHVAMSRPGEARALVDGARKADPTAPGPNLIEALMLDQDGDLDGARTAYARAVELGTANSYALYRVSILSWRGADDAGMEQIEKQLTRAVELSPLYANAHAALAEVRAELKRPQNTIATHMQRAVTLDPSSPWHRLSAARVLARLNAIPEARKAAESALKLSDDDPRARAEAERILAMLKGRSEPPLLQ